MEDNNNMHQSELIHHKNNKETPSQVVCLSGCMDDQTSADAYLQGQYNGAMTWALVNVLTRNDTSVMSWNKCVKEVRDELVKGNFTQVPQLTSGQKMDMLQTSIEL